MIFSTTLIIHISIYTPQISQIIKIFVVLITAAIMCLSLAACGSNKPKLEGLQQEIYDAAETIGCKEVSSGYEYSFPDFELKDGSKQEVSLLLLVADDTPYIVDRDNGKVYAEKDVPQDFEIDNGTPLFIDKEDIFSTLIYFEETIETNGMLWADYETLTPIENADLDAANAALK